MEFLGYRRENGAVGTRNLVGVFSMVTCANEVTAEITRQVKGCAYFMHGQGCAQTSVDIDRVNSTLAGLGANPNIASVLLVSLGCESSSAEKVAKAIAQTGKQVETIVIQDIGGAARSVAEGSLLAQEMVAKASRLKRTPCPMSEIVLGLKCGSSDTTQGLAANPALGIASDMLVDQGGISILGEVTEFMGAEHILARRAKDKKVADQIFQLVRRMEDRAMSMGVDMRGGQPTKGNIAGGLSSIEEKSLGAIAKSGSSVIQDVYEYGQPPRQKGLVVMDSPGREPEILTGLAAAGCNLIGFATGLGAPQGFPFVPVLKITGNPNTWRKMRDHMDVDVSSIIDGSESLFAAGKRLFREMAETASGRLTRAEITGYSKSMDIYMQGPVI
jgi:altronate dehydratase large subunit